MYTTIESGRRIYPAPQDETRICVICNQPFHCGLREWAYSFRKRQTCGTQCGMVLSGQQRKVLCDIPCGFCSKMFSPRTAEDVFCSRPCYWANKKGRPATYVPPEAPRFPLPCPECGTIVLRRAKDIERGRRFCSLRCARQFHTQQRMGTHYPLTGTNDFYLSKHWSKLKRQIKKRDKYTCQACLHPFRAESAGMIVHHIRPRELFQTFGILPHAVADAWSNLVTLCRSCHQKVHAGHYPALLDITPRPNEQLRLFA